MSGFGLHTSAISPPISGLTPEELQASFHTFKPAHINAFIRQWLTEGIPIAFAPHAFLYEELRAWMSLRFGIPAKLFSIVGSARLGFSLKKERFGKPFTASSDLDFTCVDSSFFIACMTDAERWAHDYDARTVTPSNDRERGFWEDTRSRLDQNIRSGFIQTHHFPPRRTYPKIRDVLNSMSLIPNKLKMTYNAPQISTASLRVYRDWDALTAQVAINLRSALG